MSVADNTPTKVKSRIIDLDVFRGFAIFGIFMVNILVMNVSFVFRGEWEAEQTGWIQDISFFTLETFFYSKFFVIFSFLFGIGVAIQIERAKEKNQFSNLFFLRRFIGLFLFGVFHIIFIWSGDILHLYGALGFLLMVFFRFPPRVVLWSSILVFIFPFYGELFEMLMSWVDYNYASSLAELSRETILELKHNGSYLSGMQLRLKEYSYAMALLYSGIGPIALSMMLLGGYLVKKGFLENIAEWLKRTKVFLFILLIVFTAYRFILLYWIVPNFNVEHGSPLSVTLITLLYFSDIIFSLSYLWVIAYLLRTKTFKSIFNPLKYVGRTALSNYILQSILGYLIMRTFGLYEYFSAFDCILLVLVIFTIQILISKIWLTYFRFGPLEWLWRCISYWKILQIKK